MSDVHKDGQHRWLMGWPGNFCLCCGLDDVIETAICCEDCTFPFDDPSEDRPISDHMCEYHKNLLCRPCPCDGSRCTANAA
jgi:hypothetical protein